MLLRNCIVWEHLYSLENKILMTPLIDTHRSAPLRLLRSRQMLPAVVIDDDDDHYHSADNRQRGLENQWPQPAMHTSPKFKIKRESRLYSSRSAWCQTVDLTADFLCRFATWRTCELPANDLESLHAREYGLLIIVRYLLIVMFSLWSENLWAACAVFILFVIGFWSIKYDDNDDDAFTHTNSSLLTLLGLLLLVSTLNIMSLRLQLISRLRDVFFQWQ